MNYSIENVSNNNASTMLAVNSSINVSKASHHLIGYHNNYNVIESDFYRSSNKNHHSDVDYGGGIPIESHQHDNDSDDDVNATQQYHHYGISGTIEDEMLHHRVTPNPPSDESLIMPLFPGAVEESKKFIPGIGIDRVKDTGSENPFLLTDCDQTMIIHESRSLVTRDNQAITSSTPRTRDESQSYGQICTTGTQKNNGIFLVDGYCTKSAQVVQYCNRSFNFKDSGARIVSRRNSNLLSTPRARTKNLHHEQQELRVQSQNAEILKSDTLRKSQTDDFDNGIAIAGIYHNTGNKDNTNELLTPTNHHHKTTTFINQNQNQIRSEEEEEEEISSTNSTAVRIHKMAAKKCLQSTLPRRRSRAIAINGTKRSRSNSGSTFDENTIPTTTDAYNKELAAAEAHGANDMYDYATWRMYNRIVDHRRRNSSLLLLQQQNRSKKDTVTAAVEATVAAAAASSSSSFNQQQNGGESTQENGNASSTVSSSSLGRYSSSNSALRRYNGTTSGLATSIELMNQHNLNHPPRFLHTHVPITEYYYSSEDEDVDDIFELEL